MLIQLMSDLHFEFHRDDGAALVDSITPSAEILVLPGDVFVMKQGIPSAFARLCRLFRHVIFVPGNHEYYGQAAARTHEHLYYLLDGADGGGMLQLPNLHVLGPGKLLALPDVNHRFLGATMWFPEPPAGVYRRGMVDFMAIKEFEPWVYEQHRQAVDFLTKEVRAGDIVVTHHLPSYRSVPPRYKDSDLNHFFVHDMTDLIKERRPSAWLHGHTHTGCCYPIGDTLIAANPLGYPRENSGFREDFVVEIGRESTHQET